ncbi:MAG: 1-aminocyclopropane-1-carboxylate deaminase [Sphingobacteriales bacterium]|jgi:1-aminocyclopropane-1-carboxylate deaminase
MIFNDTPIQRVDYWPEHQIFVKRDDLIHPFISGNKFRKLEGYKTYIQDNNIETVVSFGGAYSNHLLALASFCAENKLKSIGIIRGEKTLPLNDHLFLAQLFGMELHYVGREEYRNNKEAIGADYQKECKNALIIDEGGKGELGELGMEKLMNEIPIEFKRIYVAAGTGTTAKGMIRFSLKEHKKSIIEVVPVLKGDFIKNELKKEFFGANYNFNVSKDEHHGGYAKTTPKLIAFIADFIRKTGIILDPVYTGKLFFLINQHIENGVIEKKDKIIAIHSGGIFGMFGMKDKFVADKKI